MQKFSKICVLILVLLPFICISQIVDETRIGFDSKTLASQQTAIGVSPDGKFIGFAYKDFTIKIFSVTNNKFIKVFKSRALEIFKLIVLSDQRLMIVFNKEVDVVDLKNLSIIKSFPLASDIVRVDFAPKANIIGFGLGNGEALVMSTKTLEEILEIPSNGNATTSMLSISPDGKRLYIVRRGGRHESDEIYNINNGELINAFPNKPYPIDVSCFDSTSNYLFADGIGNSSFTFVKIDASTFDKITTYDLSMEAPISVLQYKGKLLVTTIFNSFHVLTINGNGALVFTTLQDKRAFFEGARNRYKYNLFARRNPDQIYPLASGKFLVSYFYNNTSFIFDADRNHVLAYFFSDSNEDFAVVAKDGRIDGTPGAFAKIFWTSRRSSKKTYLESAASNKFTPKLLNSILSENENDARVFDIDKIKVPTLELSSVENKKVNGGVYDTDQKNVKIQFEVKENGGEVEEVKLFHNAKFIKSIPANGTSTYIFNAFLNNSFGEVNYFHALAVGKSGVDSEKLKFIVNYKSATYEKPRLFLVTIGINEYKNPKYKLNYAIADANAVEQIFKQFSSTIFAEIIPYSIRNSEAIKPVILKTLDEIRTKAKEQDVLVMYYGGHGVMASDAEGEEFYLIPYDVTQLYSDKSTLEQNAISADQLKEFSQSLNAQKQLFILDACQSSGALESVATRGAAEEKAIAQLARSTGTFWMTATGSDQYASEFDKLGHGLFTFCILDGIKGNGDADKDGRLTIRELSTYVENKVPQLSEELKGSAQYPSSFTFGNDFPIVVYK